MGDLRLYKLQTNRSLLEPTSSFRQINHDLLEPMASSSIKSYTVRSYNHSSLQFSSNMSSPANSTSANSAATGDVTMNSSLRDIVKAFAPTLIFHTEEKYWPSDIDTFLSHVHLPGVSSSVDRYTLPGGSQTDEYCLTTKEGSPSASSPSATLDWFGGGSPTANTLHTYVVAVLKNGDSNDGAKQGYDLWYWWFYNYNQGKTVASTEYGNHVGDWEGIRVVVRNNIDGGKLGIVQVIYSQHDSDEIIPDLSINSPLPHQEGHPIAYVARGSHAMYPTRGGHQYKPLKETTDQTDRGCTVQVKNSLDCNLEIYLLSGTSDGDSFQPQSPLSEAHGKWLLFQGRWGNEGDNNMGIFKRLDNGPQGISSSRRDYFKNLSKHNCAGTLDMWTMKATGLVSNSSVDATDPNKVKCEISATKASQRWRLVPAVPKEDVQDAYYIQSLTGGSPQVLDVGDAGAVVLHSLADYSDRKQQLWRLVRNQTTSQFKIINVATNGVLTVKAASEPNLLCRAVDASDTPYWAFSRIPTIGIHLMVHLAGERDCDYPDCGFAGTRGEGRRLEEVTVVNCSVPNVSIEIKVRASGESKADFDNKPFIDQGSPAGSQGQDRALIGFSAQLSGSSNDTAKWRLCYLAHFQSLQDTSAIFAPDYCGTGSEVENVGERRLEGLQVWVESTDSEN